MKYSPLSAFVFALLFSACTDVNPLFDELKAITDLMHSDPQEALDQARALEATLNKEDSPPEMVKINFVIGYIYHKGMQDYSKAIVHYNKAISHAESTDPDEFYDDLILLYKNCGAIFKTFNAFGIAETHYRKSHDYASESNNRTQVLSLNHHLADLYQEAERYREAANLLETHLSESRISKRLYLEYLNTLGLISLKLGKTDEATLYYEKLLQMASAEYTAIEASAYQRLGDVMEANEDLIEAGNYYARSFELLKDSSSLRSLSRLLSTQIALGRNHFLRGDEAAAEEWYEGAEELMPRAQWKLEYTELYRLQSELFFKQDNFDEALRYQRLYSNSLTKFLEEQEKIIDADREYSMERLDREYNSRSKGWSLPTSFWISLLFILLISAMIIIVLRHLRRKIVAYKKIRQAIEATEAEKST